MAAPTQPLRVLATHPIVDESSPCPLIDTLLRAGADVVYLPLIEITPVVFEPVDIREFDWVLFTSKNAVQYFLSGLPLMDPRPNIAAVGPATAKTIKHAGWPVDFISPTSDAASAAEALCSQENTGTTILWPCGNRANLNMGDTIKKTGVHLTPLVVYDTSTITTLTADQQSLVASPFDVIVFTSPSAVESFKMLTLSTTNALIACIGPTTATAAKQALGRVDIQPSEPSLPMLAAAILNRTVSQEPVS